MKKFGILFFLCLTALSAVACSTLPMSFTTENIMKIHQGMSSNEILAMFGEPKNVDARVCAMPPNQWTCTTWEYGDSLYGSARFTFAGDHDSLILNDFKVDRD